MSEQGPEEEHKVVLTERNVTRVQSPALWLVLLAVPVILGLIISIGKNENAPPVERPVLPDIPITGVRGSGSVPVENSIISPVPQPDKASKISNENGDCDFASWVGREPSQQMVDTLKGASTGGRPYRILPPGSMMTMDHNPSRVNFGC